MKILVLFLIYCIIASVIVTFRSWQVFHEEGNNEKFQNNLIDIAKDLTFYSGNKWTFTKEDALVIFYLISGFLGFIFLPVICVRRLLGKD